MFKCMDCGNEEKFMGMVREEGRAFIYQNTGFTGEHNGGDSGKAPQDDTAINWAYIISDKGYSVSHRIERCARCNSCNIKDMKNT